MRRVMLQGKKKGGGTLKTPVLRCLTEFPLFMISFIGENSWRKGRGKEGRILAFFLRLFIHIFISLLYSRLWRRRLVPKISILCTFYLTAPHQRPKTFHLRCDERWVAARQPALHRLSPAKNYDPDRTKP